MNSGARFAKADVLDIALMRITPRLIPVDSSNEAFIESRMHDQGRAFEKSLRYDSTASDFFPDFWLLDTPEQVPVEVFGMPTYESLELKAHKVELYKQRFGVGWWCWDSTADPNQEHVPSFPDAQPTTVDPEPRSPP